MVFEDNKLIIIVSINIRFCGFFRCKLKKKKKLKQLGEFIYILRWVKKIQRIIEGGSLDSMFQEEGIGLSLDKGLFVLYFRIELNGKI